MQYFDEDLELASELIKIIEDDYGVPIARIPYFQYGDEKFTYTVKIIFQDYRYLEANIKVIPLFDTTTINVDGTFY